MRRRTQGPVDSSDTLPVTDRADVKMDELTVLSDPAHPQLSSNLLQIGQGHPRQSHISGHASGMKTVSRYMAVPPGQLAVVGGRTVPRVQKKRFLSSLQTVAGGIEQEKQTGVDPYLPAGQMASKEMAQFPAGGAIQPALVIAIADVDEIARMGILKRQTPDPQTTNYV